MVLVRLIDKLKPLWVFIVLIYLPNYTFQQQICSQNPCYKGDCVVTSYGSGFHCNCYAGFTGLLCETPHFSPNGPCSPNPCLNSGECRLRDSTYFCNCPPNFTGSKCEIQITQTNNLCSNNPCRNGGTCLFQSNLATCICLANYSGLRCEILIGETNSHLNSQTTTTSRPNPCASYPCASGATCLYSLGSITSFACYCPPNFTGTLCNIPIASKPYLITSPTTTKSSNACQSFPCLNSGTCVPINQAYADPPYACICDPNYTGIRCEISLLTTASTFTTTTTTTTKKTTTTTKYNSCSSNPCLFGYCLPISNTLTYVCVCNAGYRGTNCNEYIQTTNSYNYRGEACDSFPCLNGATCINVPAHVQPAYACTCPPNYTGLRCELFITALTTTEPYFQTIPNSCLSDPCMNDGKCVQSQFGFLCKCLPNFTGLRCEERKSTPQYVDLCTPSSCFNGGQCHTTGIQNNQYTLTCFCSQGFTGSRCQTPLTISTHLANNCKCLNGGVCMSNGLCNCRNGYYGPRCEYYQYGAVSAFPIAANYSSSNSIKCPPGLCVNGRCASAVSRQLNAAFYCICDWGWSGPRCNIKNYCQTYSQMCQNGAQCVNTQSGFRCQCSNGFNGSYCEKKMFDSQSSNLSNSDITCSSYICNNGGTCYLRDGQLACQCPRNYLGLTCEQDICHQAPLVGLCHALIPRYYYNKNTKKCELFNYGGCGGNENNFGTFEVCNFNCYGH